MIDGYGRTIDYIRISVTDRCNLRCVYCMPEQGIPPVSHQEILRFDEICRLAGIFGELGIRKIKLTGGEPLVRKNLPVLVKLLKETPGIEKVTLTTNGVLLAEQMRALADAGIDGINLSLDTLDPDIFAAITRRRELERVKEGFLAALHYPGDSFEDQLCSHGAGRAEDRGAGGTCPEISGPCALYRDDAGGLGKRVPGRFGGGDPGTATATVLEGKKRSGVGWETARRTTIPFRDFRERSVLSAP